MMRQPIVVVLGQVDAGKTTFLDKLRSTNVQGREAGAITQAIGASEIPTGTITALCAKALERNKIKLTIPGLLFIDTPGHEAFSNLRQRGGSIADIAVVVVDLLKGVEPQTIESLQILKRLKVPFIIAANKIDSVEGFRPLGGGVGLFSDSIASQRPDVSSRIDELAYSLVGQLYDQGFSAERFDRVTDFSKQVLIVPVSAREGDGVADVLMYLAGLAQRYLEARLQADEALEGRAKVLELRDEKGLGKAIDAILYQGTIAEGDPIIFATLEGPFESRVKALLKPKGLDDMRDPQEKFQRVQQATPAAGVRIACEGAEKALAGSSLFVARTSESVQAAKDSIAAEIKQAVFEGEAQGIIVKADALGSLEAILGILSDKKVAVRSAGIGPASRKEVLEASSVGKRDKYLGAILCFNQPTDPDTMALADKEGVRIFNEGIIYNLLEGYLRWIEEDKAAAKRDAFSTLTTPAKIKLLPDHCFRTSKPMVVGVEILAGTLKSGVDLLNSQGARIGTLKQIQRDKEAVPTARKGEQLAVSIEGPVFGRNAAYGDEYFSDVSKDEIALLEGKYSNALSEEERALLKEIKLLKGIKAF